EVSLDDGARGGPARRLELEGQPVEVLLPILGPLAVSRFLVVAGTAREVGCQGILGAGDGPVADAVAVHVLVPLEAAQPLEICRGAYLPSLDRLRRIGERAAQPEVHAQVQVHGD